MTTTKPKKVATNEAPVAVVGAATPSKAGVKTTELWVTMLSTVLMAVWPSFPKGLGAGVFS